LEREHKCVFIMIITCIWPTATSTYQINGLEQCDTKMVAYWFVFL